MYMRVDMMSGQLYSSVQERRDKIQIFHDIIKVSARPTNTTRILRLANIQYNTFKEYIDTLLKAGFLERIKGELGTNSKTRTLRTKTSYQATYEGLEWCVSLKELYEALEIYSLE